MPSSMEMDVMIMKEVCPKLVLPESHGGFHSTGQKLKGCVCVCVCYLYKGRGYLEAAVGL